MRVGDPNKEVLMLVLVVAENLLSVLLCCLPCGQPARLAKENGRLGYSIELSINLALLSCVIESPVQGFMVFAISRIPMSKSGVRNI